MDGEIHSDNGDSFCAFFGLRCRFARIAFSEVDGAADTALPWAAPPPRLAPLGRCVDLWFAQLDSGNELEPQLAADLSRPERARAERFRFAADRRRFVARRAWLRRVLAAYLGTTASDLVIDASPLGKPFVRRPTAPQVSFSLSHSSGWALAAVTASRDVGVDVETLPPGFSSERLAKRWLSAGEQKELAALAPRLRPDAFLRGWTCKEAFSKATGLGLDLCPQRVRVAPETRWGTFLADGRTWRTLGFAPHPYTVAALVAEQEHL